MNYLPVDPVGLTGLTAFGLGGVLFVISLLAARQRVRRHGISKGGHRSPQSMLWIIGQGIGIGIAGLGRIEVSLVPFSAAALWQGGVVLALVLATVGLFNWSTQAMGKNWAIVAQTRSDATLVTSGPFAIIRNPIYVALFLFMLAMAVAYGHGRNLFLAIPVYGYATWMRVRLEEGLLRAEFGGAYDAYTARVKRFIPGVI